MKKNTIPQILMALLVFAAAAAACTNTNDDSGPADDYVPLAIAVEPRQAGTNTRQAGTPTQYHLTINGEARTYTLAADGTTLLPTPGEDPVLIRRSATTAAVQAYGTAWTTGPGASPVPYIINNPTHPITGAATGAATLTLNITPASAQVSITVVDKTNPATPIVGLEAVAGLLRMPMTFTGTGHYVFNDANPDAVTLRAAAIPRLNTLATGYSAPAECIPTTVDAGQTLFTITAGTNTTYAGRTYTVVAPAAGITLQPGQNHRFKIQLDNAEATIVSTTIGSFETGSDIGTTLPVPNGYDVVIRTKADLKDFRDRVNAGKETLRALQVADIDLENEEWKPIGTFRGTYNGSGYTIKNMKITGTYPYTGLFGWVVGGALTGIRLESVDINVTENYAGALVGQVNAMSNNPAIISHCTAQGTVRAKSSVGGLVGSLIQAHITHCHTQCTVTATSNTAGGLIGGINNGSKVVACSATGTGSVTTTQNAGGLAGLNYGDIRFCLATQTAGGSTTTSSNAGGFVGNNNGTITACFATGGATGNYAGTFAGRNTNGSTITHCHAIPGNGTANGPVGNNEGTYSISTDPALRYATITTDADNTIITVRTIRHKPGTGEAILPAQEATFRATDVWTNEEFPQIINHP